jgi:predicted transglutaminase-like cysteine proteinase
MRDCILWRAALVCVASACVFALPAAAHENAPPPRGLLDYCARAGEACGAGAAQRTESARAAPRRDSAERQRDWFRVLLRERAEAAELTAIELTEARRRELAEVNRSINTAIAESTDEAIYGVTEFWATPLTAPTEEIGANPRGDCEDYVLEKRLRLLALGWPPETLSIAMAHAPFRGLHVVLIVRTLSGDMVLDSAHDEITGIEALPYQWQSRQSGPDLLRWVWFSGPSAESASEASESPSEAAPTLAEDASE